MSRPEILYTHQAVERAAKLAEACLEGNDPTDQATLVDALQEALEAVNGDPTRQRELIASLAGLAGQAVRSAAHLALVISGRSADGELLPEEEANVLRECAEALHEQRKAVDRRSGLDRRLTPDRRRTLDDSAAARVNQWLHGDRRSGDERRSGSDRRQHALAA